MILMIDLVMVTRVTVIMVDRETNCRCENR